MAIGNLKSYLHARFHIEDLCPLMYSLGIEVAHSEQGICLSQHKCTLNLLQDIGLLGARPFAIPMDQNAKVTGSDGALLHNPISYRMLIGRLIYVTVTRLDIMYHVHSQFMHQPKQPYMVVALCIFRYLKESPG